MKRALIATFIFFSFSSTSFALCKYQAADGSWTYAKTCTRASKKEIDQSAISVLKKNAANRKSDFGIEGRRLRGFEYSDTTHSGMRIPMVEPNKGPPENYFTSQ